MDASGLNKLPRAVSPGIDKVTESANRGSTAVSRFGSIIRGALAGFGILALTKMADEWAGVEGRVGIVTNGIEEQKQALAGLYSIAQATGQEYTATAGLFQSVQRNAKELALTLDDSLKLTDTIGKALTMGGGSQASQQAALTQLGQALGSGALRGEELNSVMEQAPRLAQAIAEAFGTTVGKLKELGKSGKLTSKELSAGLLKQAQKINDEFDRMPMTFGRAFTRLKNSLGQQVDNLNKNTKAAQVFYKVTSLIVDNLGAIIKWVAYLGAAAGLTKLAGAASRAGGAVGMLAAWLARMGGGYALGMLIGTFLRMLVVVKAIQLVFEDLMIWFKGGNSLLGRVIGPSKDWKWVVDGVKTSLTDIQKIFESMGVDIKGIAQSWGTIGIVLFGIIRLIGLVPSILIAGLLAWISVFKTNWSQLGNDIKYGLEMLGTYLKNTFQGAWDYVVTSAKEAWAKVGQIISDAIPDFVKSGASWTGNVIGEGVGNLRTAAQWAGAMPTRPGTGGAGPVTQTANVTVNAQTNTPAAVADAARRGTQDALGAAALPMVEVSR